MVDRLRLDLPDHPSSRSAGGVFISSSESGVSKRVLMTAVHPSNRTFDLPRRAILWDETPEEAACHSIQEVTGQEDRLRARHHLGNVETWVEDNGDHYLNLVGYYLVSSTEPAATVSRANSAEATAWITVQELEVVPLSAQSLRPLLASAFQIVSTD